MDGTAGGGCGRAPGLRFAGSGRGASAGRGDTFRGEFDLGGDLGGVCRGRQSLSVEFSFDGRLSKAGTPSLVAGCGALE